MNKKYKSLPAILSAAALLLFSAPAFASNQPTLNQTVNNGTLSTDIYQSNDSTPVSSPAVSFSAVNESFTCQTSTATLGDSNDKVNVTNLDSSGHSGWTLAMAATGGGSATWSDGSGHTYKYNDATGSGCTNGQLTVNPTAATLTDDCSGSCSDTDVTKGSSTAFSDPSTNSVTLLSDSDYSPWEGYLTGIGLSQKIPASQYAASYSLGMTITVTAN